MPIVPATDPRSQWFVSCDELFGDKRGTPYTMEGRRDYERKYLVVAKTHLHPNSVALCPFLPKPGELYVTPDDYDLLALMIRMDCQQEGPLKEDYQNWVVTLQYSTDVPTRGGPPDNIGSATSPSGSQNNPDLEFPEVVWDNETAQVPALKDLDNEPMITSNELPMDPPPTFESGYPVLQITRNEYGYNAEKAADWMFALNDQEFLGYPRECVQCIRISAPQVWRGKLRYFRVTYRLRFARKRRIFDDATGKERFEFVRWQPEYIDQGVHQLTVPKTYELNNRSARLASIKAGNVPPEPKSILKAIRTNEHVVVNKPVLLNGKGVPAVENQFGFKEPYYIKRRLYPTKSFSELLVKGVA